MKVAQILLSERVGGAESLVASLAQEWTETGVENVTLYVDTAGASSNALARARRLRKALVRARPDVVLAHSAIPAIYARMCAPSSASIYVVLHSAADDYQDPKLDIAERLLRFRTDGVVAVSAAQAAAYRARYGEGVRLHVIPNGIGRAFAQEPTAQDVRSSPRLISAVARLVPQKNPDMWLRAVAAVISEDPALSAEWWGPDEDIAYGGQLRRLAADLGLDGVFRGGTSSPAEVYRRSDILLHTSAREAHSVGLLEAAASGVPIVCSEDVAETLPNDLAVSTFRTGDLSDLITKLAYLRNNWKEAVALAQMQAPRIVQEFGAEKTAKRYLSLFENRPTARWGIKA